MDSDNEIKSVPSDVKQSGEEFNGSSEVDQLSMSSRTKSVEPSQESSRNVSENEGTSIRSGSFKRSSMSSAFSESSDVVLSESRSTPSTPVSPMTHDTVTTTTDDDDDRPFFANPFDSDMERGEKMLRLFIIFGILPFPVIGWIIGLFASLSIKKKKKIHKKLISTLFLLCAISMIIGIIILGYFLVRNSDVKKKDDNKPSTEPSVVPKVLPPGGDKPSPSLPSDPDPAITPGIELGDIITPTTITQDIIPTKQVSGVFKPVVAKKFKTPVFRFETPKLPYIPPTVLEPPVTARKEIKDLQFDYFEYKHPSSKNNMVMLFRELDSSWKWHPMFRFSEFIDNTVLVINLTKNDKKKTITELLEDLESEFKIKSRENLTLVSDLGEDEMIAFEKMKIKRVFAINPKMRCETSELKEPFVEFASLFDDKITCNLKSQEFPLMLTTNGKIQYVGRKAGLVDIKTNLYANKEKCNETIKRPETTKIYLDKIYSPLRKFLTTSTESVKTNDLLVEALCSKIKE